MTCQSQVHTVYLVSFEMSLFPNWDKRPHRVWAYGGHTVPTCIALLLRGILSNIRVSGDLSIYVTFYARVLCYTVYGRRIMYLRYLTPAVLFLFLLPNYSMPSFKETCCCCPLLENQRSFFSSQNFICCEMSTFLCAPQFGSMHASVCRAK